MQFEKVPLFQLFVRKLSCFDTYSWFWKNHVKVRLDTVKIAFLTSLFSSSVEPLLLTECRGNTERCSADLPAVSGEIVRCVPSTQSPWPGRGDGSLCPESWSHEQVSFFFLQLMTHLALYCLTTTPLSWWALVEEMHTSTCLVSMACCS